MTTLDDSANENDVSFVDVLELDAEGFDLDLLEGASKLFAEHRVDLVVFEFASGWIATRRTLFEANQFLTEKGYSDYRLFPRFVVPYEYSVLHEGVGLVGHFVALGTMSSSPGRTQTNLRSARDPHQIRTRRFPPSGSSADRARGVFYAHRLARIVGAGSGYVFIMSTNRGQVMRVR